MNQERLERLATALERIAKRPLKNMRFNLREWRSTGLKKNTNGCGTAACAVGYACTLPSFKKEGLYLGDENESSYAGPMFDGHRCWDAVSVFFNLSYSTSMYLFSADYYARWQRDKPQAVAKRIRQFIRQQRNAEAA